MVDGEEGVDEQFLRDEGSWIVFLGEVVDIGDTKTLKMSSVN